jgi:acyl-CoA thioester hydrolase
VTVFLRMLHAETGALHATYEIAEVFFDPTTRKSAPMPDAVRAVYARYLTED